LGATAAKASRRGKEEFIRALAYRIPAIAAKREIAMRDQKCIYCQPAMKHCPPLAAFAVMLLPLAASASDTRRLADLPAPVAEYAERFDGECAMNGLGPALANEMLADTVFGKTDVNGDGERDYLAYACMFGCEGAPFAFVTAGLPCASGVLILSEGSGHRTYSLPGTVNKVVEGETLRVVTTRRRFMHDPFCHGPNQCEYVFELRGGRFQMVGVCPPVGCEEMLKQ
jgi:hypothetical protein